MASRYPFPATPDGWFAIARREDLARGDVKALRYFGRELVMFRGADDRARVLDAYCPHLGAHLGHGGRVCGDGIACPFHGWRFDGEGRLVEIPRLARKLPDARVGAWPACEANGFVYAWHHAEGKPPSYDVARHRADAEAWTDWRASAHTVRVHVQDMTENILDRAHFVSVHDMAPPEREHFDVRFEGASLIVDQLMKVTAVSAAGIEVRSRTTTCGPGLVAVEVKQGSLDMLSYITQTPIDDELTDVRLCFSMRRLPDDEATARIAELNERITREQFEQDVPIWEHKIYRARPALTEIDGPVAQYRAWFRQFYSTWDGVQEKS